jgi:hypothetical protein
MTEGFREFGKRNRSPGSSKEIAPATRDFQKFRSAYERLRKHDAEMDRLFTVYDSIASAQESRFGVHNDAKEREAIERQIEKRYEELSGT